PYSEDRLEGNLQELRRQHERNEAANPHVLGNTVGLSSGPRRKAHDLSITNSTGATQVDKYTDAGAPPPASPSTITSDNDQDAAWAMDSGAVNMKVLGADTTPSNRDPQDINPNSTLEHLNPPPNTILETYDLDASPQNVLPTAVANGSTNPEGQGLTERLEG